LLLFLFAVRNLNACQPFLATRLWAGGIPLKLLPSSQPNRAQKSHFIMMLHLFLLQAILRACPIFVHNSSATPNLVDLYLHCCAGKLVAGCGGLLVLMLKRSAKW